MSKEQILVTGAAGFIGMHLSKLLLESGHSVVGVDNLNDYYDVTLKKDRLKQLDPYPGFEFVRLDVSEFEPLLALFKKHLFKKVVHLAAQAGVRYSLENPHVYGTSNLIGFLNILESCRSVQVDHLVFASSSSVYGSNTTIPFTEDQKTDHPVSLYAATKKSNELMAHAYAHLYKIPMTGLRFFTVYGPWGRPDMAPMLFTKTILEGKTLNIFNHGKMKRDFTYVDDIVKSVAKLIDLPPTRADLPFDLYNIGNHQPVELLEFISLLENELGVTAKKNYLPMQPGEVVTTYADVSSLEEKIKYRPDTELKTGLKKLIQWYRDYY